jgi:Rieske Fe-S protein
MTTRREFLRCAASTSIGLVATGACASVVTRPVPVAGGIARLRLAEFPSLASADGRATIQPDGFASPVVVLALGGDQYSALTLQCTHQGCTVNPGAVNLVCPCHGSTFDRRGAVLRGPAERPLPRFRVSRDDGGVLAIHLSETL